MRAELQMVQRKTRALVKPDKLLAVKGGEGLRELDCAGTTSRCGRTSRAIFLRAEDRLQVLGHVVSVDSGTVRTGNRGLTGCADHSSEHESVTVLRGKTTRSCEGVAVAPKTHGTCQRMQGMQQPGQAGGLWWRHKPLSVAACPSSSPSWS